MKDIESYKTKDPDYIKKYSNIDPEQVLFDHLYKKFGQRFLDYRKRYYDSINLETKSHEGQYPNTIILELVNRCNLECVMCYQGWRNDSQKHTLDEDTLNKIFKDFEKNNLNSLMLSISEPLLYKKIDRVLKMSEEAGIMDLFLFTNGTLLHEKNAKMILESSVTRLFVSLDALTKNTYDKVRIPVSKKIDDGRLKRVEENIKNFVSLRNSLNKKLPLVRVSYVKQKYNEHEVEEFIKKWENIVDSVEVQNEVSINAYDQAKKLTHEEMFLKDKPNSKKYNCRQPWGSFGIYSDGSATPCCNTFGRTMPVGNIKTDSISNIWKSSKMKQIRDNFESNEPCKGCKICLDNTDGF